MKSITPGQELTKDQEAEITELRKEGLKTLESTLRTIVDIELVGKKQMALLTQQSKAVGKIKNNSEERGNNKWLLILNMQVKVILRCIIQTSHLTMLKDKY